MLLPAGGQLMLREFQEWFEKNGSWLDRKGVRALLKGPSRGLDKNSVSAELTSDRYEALVLVWETGESDFHVAPMDASSDVEVTHYEFDSTDELSAALVQLMSQMS